jgi:diguanylate cyclase
MAMRNSRLTGPEGLALGHQTIDEVGRQRLAVSPRNYEIWLAYITDSAPHLRAAIDELIAKGAKLDDATLEALYQKHFSRSGAVSEVLDTGSRIAHEIADALDALKYMATHTGRYGETLDAATVKLRSGVIDRASLQSIVSHLAVATTDMSARNVALADKLAESSAEMEQLRVSLHEAKSQALTDGLTGIANRKRFDETLALRRDEARHDGTPLALVLADIDHFKKFNDTWGHQIGDVVIRMVATAISKVAMPDHLVARLGGEEFAIIMPRATLLSAAQFSENLRKAIHANRLRRKETQEIIGHISVSFGVACLRPGEDITQLIARADECLYHSKRRGRNCVSIETDLNAAA